MITKNLRWRLFPSFVVSTLVEVRLLTTNNLMTVKSSLWIDLVQVDKINPVKKPSIKGFSKSGAPANRAANLNWER